MSERVADEAQMLTTLNHPSLVRGYGFFMPKMPDGPVVILMRNCPGGSLAEVIEKGSLTATQKNKVIVSLALGLAFLHSQCILHRDVKPSNVMVDAFENALFGDFGSARVIEPGTTQTGAAQTTSYQAPELHDDGSEPSEASDVWALGLTVFEVIAGKPAFDPGMRLRPPLKCMDSNKRPSVPRETSPVLKEVLKRCWDKDPMRRPTVAEICVKFAEAEWLLVEGAMVQEVKAYAMTFPLDPTARKELPR
jgi:serine/threonine protein kinase